MFLGQNRSEFAQKNNSAATCTTHKKSCNGVYYIS